MQCSCVSTPRWTDVLCGYCDAKTRFGVRAELPARAKCLHLRKTVEDYMRIYFTPMPGIGCGGVALKSVKLSLWQGKCGGRCLEQKRKTQAKTSDKVWSPPDTLGETITINIPKTKPLHVGTVRWSSWADDGLTSGPEAMTMEQCLLRRGSNVSSGGGGAMSPHEVRTNVSSGGGTMSP
ncbi:hypothetical protein Tco_0403524 [Tanacetum coccineum]